MRSGSVVTLKTIRHKDFDIDKPEDAAEVTRIENNCNVLYRQATPYPEMRDRTEITIYSVYMVWEEDDGPQEETK
jgi:hypothetical protein